jgi:single-stranded-DNA-specific exonuclease
VVEDLVRQLSVPRAAAEILLARGFGDAEKAQAFLDVDPGRLKDPFVLQDLRAAAQRLALARERGERVVVHGDYDCDGISGTALLTGGLRRVGVQAEPFVPDRERDGYGVSRRLVEHAGEHGVSLLITVDTGSSAHEALARARELGIEAIVCDHHLFDERPLGASYLINPQRSDDDSDSEDLCGAAIAWKLLRGLELLLDLDAGSQRELDLVALALLADQVPLVGENRALVRLGLQQLRRDQRPGLTALRETARIIPDLLDEQDVLFQLAPRINAAGRISSARHAVDLLLAQDLATARPLAHELDSLNRQRRELDARVTEEALVQAADLIEAEDPAGLVLASDDWHMGVVGIAASRVVERFHRPSVLLAMEEGEGRGSGRSVEDVHLKHALDACAEHLVRYGGHAMAVGMTLERRRLSAFRGAFAAAVASLPRENVVPPLELDAILPLEALQPELVEFLRDFGPYGAGHREPSFAVLGLEKLSSRVIKEKHLKLEMAQGSQRRSFIGFGLAPDFAHHVEKWPMLDLAIQIRYRPDSRFDPWQLTIRDLRAAEGVARAREEVSG